MATATTTEGIEVEVDGNGDVCMAPESDVVVDGVSDGTGSEEVDELLADSEREEGTPTEIIVECQDANGKEVERFSSDEGDTPHGPWAIIHSKQVEIATLELEVERWKGKLKAAEKDRDALIEEYDNFMSNGAAGQQCLPFTQPLPAPETAPSEAWRELPVERILEHGCTQAATVAKFTEQGVATLGDLVRVWVEEGDDSAFDLARFNNDECLELNEVVRSLKGETGQMLAQVAAAAPWRSKPLRELEGFDDGLMNQIALGNNGQHVHTLGELWDLWHSPEWNTDGFSDAQVECIDAALDMVPNNGAPIKPETSTVEDDSWRSDPISALKLGDTIERILVEAELTTLGAFSDFMAKHGEWWSKRLRGIGPQKREKIDDAWAAFWAKRKAAKGA